MGAPIGNRFWEQRSKHGRDKLFSSPDVLWEAAAEYFTITEDNPFKQQNWVGKDGEEVHKNLMRPFTLSGLCVFLHCDERTLRMYGNEETHKDFLPVYTRIYDIIRTQKFEGAAAGLFNASIIARDLGLTEKTDNTHTVKDFNVTLDLK